MILSDRFQVFLKAGRAVLEHTLRGGLVRTADLIISETAARMMPGDETTSGMANPTQEGIPSSSSSTK